MISSTPINEFIKADRMQVISSDGENLGVLTKKEALRVAQEAGMDLVVLTDKDGEVIAKIMDFGKNLYAKKKKAAENKKKQKIVKVKELKLKPKIGEHDYKTKFNQAVGFLNEGNRVKVTLVFRGREASMKEERGAAMFDKIDADFVQAGLQVISETDTNTHAIWSKIYYLKPKK
jgi:translation initiation factor IF-3